jgi:hypothetical protein
MTVRDEMAQLVTLGALAGPTALERWVAALDATAEHDAAQWVSEDRALRRSGKSLRWLRRHWRQWEKDGYARKEHGARVYFAAVLPQGRLALVPADDAREQARRDAAA